MTIEAILLVLNALVSLNPVENTTAPATTPNTPTPTSVPAQNPKTSSSQQDCGRPRGGWDHN